jgi:uncharacterized peroxidase-related enzyme
MTRINLDTTRTPANSQPTLNQVTQAFGGTTPNMFKATANSPAALRMMWAAFGALGGGTLGAALGEQVAVAVANANRCEYCLAAHTALGQKAGVSGDTLARAQLGESDDPRTAAALRFALKVVQQRAQISDADVAELHEVGLGDEQVMELLAHVALNVFTNYVNVAFAVPVDFAPVALK